MLVTPPRCRQAWVGAAAAVVPKQNKQRTRSHKRLSTSPPPAIKTGFIHSAVPLRRTRLLALAAKTDSHGSHLPPSASGAQQKATDGKEQGLPEGLAEGERVQSGELALLLSQPQREDQIDSINDLLSPSRYVTGGHAAAVF